MKISDEWQTYSFDSAGIGRILKELLGMLAQLGVDPADRAQLKRGLEQMFNIEYHGLPNLDSQGYILASNHVSDFDALILGLTHPNIKIIAKSAWVDSPALAGFLGLHYDLVGIDRSSRTSQARAMVEVIKHLGRPGAVTHALIFPQGTISDLGKNSLERIQPGAFTLSCKSGAPVLPVYMEQPNFHHPTRVVFGAPMPVPEKRQDCRALWRQQVLALQDSLDPPARTPVLTEKHANNNKPGDPFF